MTSTTGKVDQHRFQPNYPDPSTPLQRPPPSSSPPQTSSSTSPPPPPTTTTTTSLRPPPHAQRPSGKAGEEGRHQGQGEERDTSSSRRGTLTSSVTSSSALVTSTETSSSSPLVTSRPRSSCHSNHRSSYRYHFHHGGNVINNSNRTKKKKVSFLTGGRRACFARGWLKRMWSTSVREAVLVLILVALASLTITFHLGHRLSPPSESPHPQRHDDVHPNDLRDAIDGDGNHLNIHRSLQLSDSNSAGSKNSKVSVGGVARFLRRSRGGEKIGTVSLNAGEESKGADRGKDNRAGRDDRDGGALFTGSKASGSASEFRNVLKVLQEREEATLRGEQGRVRVVVAGSNPQLSQDALLVESALRKHSARVAHLQMQDGDGDDELGRLELDHQGRWSVLLCLNTTAPDDACVVTAASSLFNPPHRKINVIPGLQEVLRHPELLCRHNGSETQGHWLNSDGHCSNFSEATAHAWDKDWTTVCDRYPLLVSPSPSAAAMQLSVCSETAEKPEGAIAIELPSNLLTLKDLEKGNTDEHSRRNTVIVQKDQQQKSPSGETSDWRTALTWRFPVLLTSLSPLRVYMHSEGVVWDGLTSHLQQKSQRGLSLLELQQMAADCHGDGVAAATVAYLEESVMDVLVQWEQLLPSNRQCQRCFQLLEVTTLFNSTFHPFILQIGASSLSGQLSSLSEYLVRQTSLNDLAVLLTERRNVSLDLARALLDLGLSTVARDTICNADKKFCLSPRELDYLLDALREHLAKTGWKRVYPSASAVRFTGLLQAGAQTTTTTTSTTKPLPAPVTVNHSVVASSRREDPDPNRLPLKTRHLHSLLLGLESFFLRASEGTQSESFEDLNVPIDQPNQRASGSQDAAESGVQTPHDSVTGPPCSADPGSMPYLSSLVTRPVLTLQPEFSPFRTDYTVEVDHSIQLVTVWAWSQSCQSQARLEDKHNTDRWANFTLGLGVNTLRVFVVDASHDEPWVLNTYTLSVRRLEPDHGLGSFHMGTAHVVCSLKQDCSLPYAPKEPCGLQPVNAVTSWADFLNKRAGLPPCSSGDVPGQWFVPCSSCRDDDGRCYWKEAVWSPVRCKEVKLSQSQLQQCLKGKKVLFIGDSTNRGILHYMSQRVNGCLWEWPDKTHHLRVYPPLNHNSTQLSFAYYPQFWLPAMHRPVFDKALYQLIRRSFPLDNSSNTVVVVGGVHWLATHHLKVVQTALAREGLTGVQVIVKGLGSGFHQPVSGVHQLSQRDQEKLLWHNQRVLSYARDQGMAVVDTFNITMARYASFLQGRCTCHFHRITPEKHHKKGYHSPTVTTFNVEGDINAVYSEMVINRICHKPS